jgi:ankyrin repeat protein
MTEKSIEKIALRGDLSSLHLLKFDILKTPSIGKRFSLNADDALIKSCFDGDIIGLNIAISRGAKVNRRNKTKDKPISGHYPLTIASQQGNFEICKILIEEYEADIDVMTPSGWTSLCYACKEGHQEIVKLILNNIRNIDIVSSKNKCGKTALMWASREGHLKIVDQLLRKGASIEAKTRDGGTAVHLAASQGHDHILNLLLSRGTSALHVDKQIRNALMIASKYGYVETAKVTHQAIMNQEDKIEKMMKESRGEYEKPVNLIDCNGKTALHIATESGNLGLVKLLINFEADVNIRDFKGQTPLIKAAQRGHSNIIRFLLESHANQNILCIKGWSALMWACAERKLQAARLLNPDNVAATKRIKIIRDTRLEKRKKQERNEF